MSNVVAMPRHAEKWPKIGKKSGLPLANDPKNFAVAIAGVGLKFRMNAFDGKAFVATKAGEWEELSDALLRDAYWSVRKFEVAGLSLAWTRQSFDDHVMWLAEQNSFHPVKDYLDALKWDGEPRIDTWLTTYAQVEETAYSRAVGRKFLAAAVARIYEPGIKFDHLLILEGTQGLLKSTAAKIMAGDHFTDALSIGDDVKESMEKLSGVWIAEFSEMEGAGKREIEAIKSQLSRQVDRSRMAYGRTTVSLPRQSVFIGTINPRAGGQYLRDPTGGRRFWPVKVTAKIDTDALHRDRDQLWAEAVEAYRAGEALYLTGAELEAAEAHQAARQESHPWREILEPIVSDLTGRIATVDLYHLLGFHDATKLDQRTKNTVAEIMHALGWNMPQQMRVPLSSVRVYGFEKRLGTEPPEWVSRDKLSAIKSSVERGCDYGQ